MMFMSKILQSLPVQLNVNRNYYKDRLSKTLTSKMVRQEMLLNSLILDKMRIRISFTFLKMFLGEI
jgi:hypothetical protein